MEQLSQFAHRSGIEAGLIIALLQALLGGSADRDNGRRLRLLAIAEQSRFMARIEIVGHNRAHECPPAYRVGTSWVLLARLEILV